MFDRYKLANTVLAGMAQTVGIKPERCSRMSHKSSACNLCETNCPTSAISVGGVGTTIKINWDECSQCGICINICPSNVYNVRKLGYEGFLTTFLRQINDEGLLLISCKDGELPPELEEVRKNAAITDCLGIFALPDFLWLYTKGARKIRLILPDCTKCRNKYGREIIEDELAELTKLSPYFEKLAGTEIVSAEHSITISFPQSFERVILIDEKKEELKNAEVTRRGMFELLGQNAKDRAIKSAVFLAPQDIPDRTPFRTDKFMPIKRLIFLEAIASLGKLLKNEMPLGPYFFSLHVSDRCTYCEVCARFCPSGALFMEEKKLIFNASMCVSCGMCLISCYHKFIEGDESMDMRELFSDVIKVSKNSTP